MRADLPRIALHANTQGSAPDLIGSVLRTIVVQSGSMDHQAGALGYRNHPTRGILPPGYGTMTRKGGVLGADLWYGVDLYEQYENKGEVALP
jgi:hypothetical protein